MKKFFLALAATAVSAVASWADPPKDSVVGVQHWRGNVADCGTGTVIASEEDRSLILTNAHVVRDAGGRLEVTHGGKTYSASFIAGSKVWDTGPGMIHVDGPDLAILEVKANLPAVTIASEFPSAGETLTLYGMGGGWREQSGRAVATEWPNALALSTPGISGNSGAGVFNSRGELCGVAWGGRGVTLAVRLDAVAVFASKCHAPLFPRFRAAVGRVASALAPKPMPQQHHTAPAVVPAPAPKAVEGPKATVPPPAPKEAPKVATLPAPKAMPAAPPAPSVVRSQCVGGVCPQAQPQVRQRGVILSFGIFRR